MFTYYMRILLLDIETAPNLAHVWGLFKQNIGLSQIIDSGYTLCFSAKWLGEPHIVFKSIHKDGKEKMLDTMWTLLNAADAVVHYNGSKFDIPTINKEFILTDRTPPTSYHQIDLLKVARNKFKFPSNKLDYVAQALGLGKKVKHIGHELWIQCMAGNEEAWSVMEEYNKQDVLLLEAVYHKFLPWITNHPNHGLYTNELTPVCPNCGSHHVYRNGIETTMALVYQRYKCKSCGTNIKGKQSVLPKEKSKLLLKQSKL